MPEDGAVVVDEPTALQYYSPFVQKVKNAKTGITKERIVVHRVK